jgi:Spy/CpxP family protein refolding chaperone
MKKDHPASEGTNKNHGEQMKPIKFSLIAAIALGVLMACSTVSNAQDDKGEKKGRKGPRMTVEQEMERLTKELALTDDQQPKIKAVVEENRKKMQELYSNSSGDRAAMREKMQGLSDERDKKFKEILKPDQYEKWEKLRDKLRDEMRKKKGGSDGEKKDDSEKKN